MAVRPRRAALAAAAAVAIVLGLLTVFAIELADTQGRSRAEVRARVHERGTLAAALIDSLFATLGQQIPRDETRFGRRAVTDREMEADRGHNRYVALLDARGRLIARSSGIDPRAARALGSSAAVALVRAGRPYGLGNMTVDGHRPALQLAVRLATPHGARILLTGLPPRALDPLFAADLRTIPGVAGDRNSLVDGRGVVLGSTSPALPPGRTFDGLSLNQSSGEEAGQYYAQFPIRNSTWRLVLAAPAAELFASASGIHEWVPWMIFVAFALAALVALALAWRVVSAAAEVQAANRRLAQLNHDLADANGALERRAAELSRSNADLERFASIASHDLQEPLRKVRAFTERVASAESEALSERGRDYLRRANAAAARMQRLIEDLLRLSRVATHGRPFAPVDLGQVTRDATADLEAPIEEARATLGVGALPTVNGDEVQLRQLMQNLISNAIKFRRDGVAPVIRIEGTVAGEVASVTVADNGIGFEPQYSDRIFRVFERLHARTAYPGTGIGLALCRRIAERHGGTIAADGLPGEGATFTVRIPVNQREEVLLPPAEPVTAAAPAAAGTTPVNEETTVAA